MSDLIGDSSETAIRLAAFAIIFAAMAGLEVLWPKRRLRAGRRRRWLTNLTVVGIDSLVLRLMASLAVPLAAVAAALYAEAHGVGLLHQVHWAPWLEIVAALLVLDFALWLQHLASHKIALFWRLHRMHHADIDIDVTTAVRFHPVEMALSMLWKIVWVLALGASPLAVLLFEIILNGCSLFNHANIALPEALDRILRAVIVTPDMHRVHHSVLRREHDSNYGFNLSVWDRAFGTYTRAPEQGHAAMTVGLSAYQSEKPTQLGWSLALPWKPLSKGD